MTSDKPSDYVGDLEESLSEPQAQAPLDLTDQTKSKNGDSRQTTSQNSPSKRAGSSPTKSKGRKKNDSKRRSANQKKQAASNDQSERQSQIPKLYNAQSEQQSSEAKTTINTKKESEIDQSIQLATPPQQHLKNEEKSAKSNSQPAEQAKVQINYEKAFKELEAQLHSQTLQTKTILTQSKQQAIKAKELETALLSYTRTCRQLEKLLQQELSTRTRLESENESLNQTVARLKKQLCIHEKNKSNSDELTRVLNATLMERETEVSILKLKLTRLQTNPSSTIALNSASSISSVKQEPSQVYASSGRSNSEFNRNSYIRSSMIAEAASVRSSTSQLRSIERDASVWANVPDDLTPSKRPLLLEKNYQDSYGETHYSLYGTASQDTSSPFSRDRRYRTLPRSMRSPSQEFTSSNNTTSPPQQCSSGNREVFDKPDIAQCQVTNLDDSGSTNQSNKNGSSPHHDGGNTVKPFENTSHLQADKENEASEKSKHGEEVRLTKKPTLASESSHYSAISRTNIESVEIEQSSADDMNERPPNLPSRTATTPVKFSNRVKRLIDKFRRSESSTNSTSKTDLSISTVTPTASPFRRGGNRSTMFATPNDIRGQMSPIRQAANFQTDKPFDEWNTDMLVDWLTMIGLSMYTVQCRRWVKCGAHIMNATPAEVDKGLGITNHLHRKKLRLAISELNGDCDKITKAAAKLDYLWVARWLDDIGLPQHKEAFINARVDGRVLNYLTVEDLISMGVKSVLHHASIRCGIKVLRSIQFDLQLLKRRATAEEIEQMSLINPQNASYDIRSPFKSSSEVKSVGDPNVSLWTCHRLMEWLRLIDFAEYAPNLRGSGVHGGLIVYEDAFNFDTLCSLLSIPIGSTLLRRHLSTYFRNLIGTDLIQKKRQYQDSSNNQQLNPLAEIKTPKKSQLWFSKLKSSKVGQDGMDDYLCPMYPVEPQLIKTRKVESTDSRESSQLPDIPESINV